MTTPAFMKPVLKPVARLDQLYASMLEQLDEENLGFNWWHGYTDSKRLALISEYLIASVTGVRDALVNAAFTFDEWQQAQFADDKWVRERIRGAINAGLGESGILQALRRTGVDERRDLRLKLAREHLFYHLAQCMDRLTAVVIGIGALNTPIIRADWNTVADERRFNRSLWNEQPPEGLAAQSALRLDVLDIVERAGPADWFQWLDGVRNTHAHRAPKISVNMLTKETKNQPPRIVHVFERQPRWSMTEAMVGGQGQSLEEVWLLDEPRALLEGLLTSISTATDRTIGACELFWERRRGAPSLLVQPAGQWPNVLAEASLDFGGYGVTAPVSLTDGTFRVSPGNGKRMRASGLFDPDLWDND